MTLYVASIAAAALTFNTFNTVVSGSNFLYRATDVVSPALIWFDHIKKNLEKLFVGAL